MASSISQASLWTSKSLASDNLKTTKNGITLKELGRNSNINISRRSFDLRVVAKLRKGKKYEYPWPKDPDPNVKGGVLTHLSYFKPLKDSQKPVTLDFEKPLMDLKNKIMDVMKLANETGLDFSDKIAALEHKYEQALKELYLHLTPIQRVGIARHPNRPTFLDHVFNITDKFVELHGDRAGYDDPAIVTGIGMINGKRYMFIGHQKGRNTKENIQRNFGMPTPHGYRKALRMMYYADHHGFPIVTFIDTPGAYADMKSEELGQGEAIAHNLRSMFGLRVPIVSIVIGEGGSGGALAIGCANKLLMMENAVFYVASPEACAAILYKTAKAAPKAAERLRITAPELCNLQIADGIIPEPLGGAHADPSWTSQQIKKAIEESMDELLKMDAEKILQHRNQKFRKIGVFQEGLPVDPIKKVNMKKKEEPLQSRDSTLKLESEVEKLKEQILKSKDLSVETPNVEVMIEKLKQEVDHELSEAAQSLGLQDELLKLREELIKAKSSKDELMHPALLDKVERFRKDLSQRLSAAPNYPRLSNKLNMLKELSQAKEKSEFNSKSVKLKQKVNEKYKEVLDQPEIKKKVEMLKFEIEKSGSSKLNDLDDGLKKRIIEVKGEVEEAFAAALKSLDLDLKIAKSNNALYSVEETLPSNVKSLIGELDEEIQRRIDDIVNSSELKSKISLLKLEATKARKNADESTQKNIQVLIKDIKDSLAEALSSSELAEKHGRLKVEIEKVLDSDGSSSKGEESGSKVDNHIGVERSYA